MSLVLALDQGTTSSRALLFDARGEVRAIEQVEFTQHYPQPGWVEHDPDEIWETQLRAARGALARAGCTARDVTAIGITNQRETTVVWERESGRPIHRAIVWQSRQTVPICDRLRAEGLEAHVRERTGLVIDAYFSASKIRFVLDAVEGAQGRAERGELAAGTIDSWLLYRLTKGAVHATEPSNASRTMLYDIHRGCWDETLLGALRIPRAMLPDVRDSAGRFGEADPAFLGASIPISGVAGDQQAALFGQGCLDAGDVKNTYGTGCFLLMNTGTRAPRSEHGLLTTVAWRLGGTLEYALEGSVFVAGAAVQWLRDELHLVRDATDTEAAARSVPDTGGVFLVPAFVGLGAPYWDERARGTIVGITRGTTREHLVRATLESIAYQSRDLIECLAGDARVRPPRLRVDGGATRNDFLMQFQADMLGIPIWRPRMTEVTAFGAAALAGLPAGVWSDRTELSALPREGTVFEPQMNEDRRESLYADWKRAVERARGWA